MMGWLVHLLVNSIVLIVVAGYFPDFYLSGLGAAFVASFVLSLLNLFVKPLLVILTLPVTMLTFGLFLIVINAITLMIAQALMGTMFSITGFGMALLAAVIISILNLLIQRIIIKPLRER